VPTFRYTIPGAGAKGGTVEAPDRASALRDLIARGVTPASLEPVGSHAAAHANGTSNGATHGTTPTATPPAGSMPGRPDAPSPPRPTGVPKVWKKGETAAPRGRSVMNLAETASFIRELATAIQAGLPLVPALRTLGRAGRTRGQQMMLNHLLERVEQGAPLAEAIRSWGKPFDELVINLVRAGEASGRLADTLHQASDLLERDLQIRRMILSATLYPIILLVLVSIAVAAVTTVIVPRVLKPLEGRRVELPIPTQVVQGFANFMSSSWWLVLLVIGAIVFGIVQARRMPGPRLAIDGFLLRIPALGDMLRDAAVARFTRTLGTLVRSGLPVLTALRLTSATMTNTAMRQAVERVCDDVQGGKTIAGPLEKSGMFPPLLVQIVSLGERSGKLPELLGQAANSLDSRTETRVKVFTGLLPPILVVGVAIIVGFVVAAIILPLLQLQDEAGRF
jgi:general secretion pathway protein F